MSYEPTCAATLPTSMPVLGVENSSQKLQNVVARSRAVLLDLRLAAAELEVAGLDAAIYLADADELSVEAIELKIDEIRTALEAHRSAMAAASRRAAVLEGLAKLGYEVTEGMSTTLADGGRLVLRSGSRTDYGVEIASAGTRMQLKPVAFETGGRGPDPARDRDAETIWCGDVSKLQSELAKLGGNLMIEKSLPIGVVPLKRIAATGVQDGGAIDAPVTRQRSLPSD